MASIQFHKPDNEPGHQQKCSNHSLTSWFKGNDQNQCSTQTQPQPQPQHHHESNGSACHGKTKKKERNLFQRIKDGLSGNDSSSSDSESDNEGGCNKRTSKKK